MTRVVHGAGSHRPRRVVAVVALALVSGCAASSTEPRTATAGGAVETSGAKAPDFELPTLDGGHASLAQYRGKVVLVDFWSTICDPCLQEMPELVKLYQERKDKGFVVLAIATDGPETAANVSAKAKERNMIFPVLLDGETAVLDRYNPEAGCRSRKSSTKAGTWC